MVDLDSAVRSWRNELARQHVLTRDDLDELEDHFRATVSELVGAGIAPDQAIVLARQAVGEPEPLAVKYKKNADPWWRRFVRVGWAMFATAFVLPVHQAGITVFNSTFGDGVIPGVQAFLVGLQGEAGPVGVISALTNVVMVASFCRIGRRGGRAVATLAAMMAGSTLLNAWWFFQLDRGSELLIGYYTWWASFGVVASGLGLRAKAALRTATPFTA